LFNVQVTPELREAMQKYEEQFDDIVPLEMVPGSESVEGLIDNIEKCLVAGKDLLPEIYGWKFDGSVIY
jgi:hypothetical protein